MLKVKVKHNDRTAVFSCGIHELLRLGDNFRFWKSSPLVFLALAPSLASLEGVEIRLRCKEASGASLVAKQLQALLDNLENKGGEKNGTSASARAN